MVSMRLVGSRVQKGYQAEAVMQGLEVYIQPENSLGSQTLYSNRPQHAFAPFYLNGNRLHIYYGMFWK